MDHHRIIKLLIFLIFKQVITSLTLLQNYQKLSRTRRSSIQLKLKIRNLKMLLVLLSKQVDEKYSSKIQKEKTLMCSFMFTRIHQLKKYTCFGKIKEVKWNKLILM